jgi:hypothetical protein
LLGSWREVLGRGEMTRPSVLVAEGQCGRRVGRWTPRVCYNSEYVGDSLIMELSILPYVLIVVYILCPPGGVVSLCRTVMRSFAAYRYGVIKVV